MAPVSQVDAALQVLTALVSRRPVHGPTGRIDAFELRFGTGQDVTGQEPAITATLLDVFSRFNAADLFGGRPGFVNLTRSFLVGRLPLPVGAESATLLITRDALGPAEDPVDADLLAGVRALVRNGYDVALDAVPYSPGLAPLLEPASLVTIDVGQLETALDEAQRFRAHGVRLLAKGISSPGDLARCVEAGFEFFEGDSLEHDDSLDIQSLSPGQSVALELVGRLSNPDTPISEIENVVRHNPELAFRLLRIANSASSGSQREVGSLHDAIVLVGVARLRSWMLLISLSPTPAAANALSDALTRAATCERVARATGTAGPESAFTVGLLHGLSEALRVPPGDLLARLPALSGELAEALLGEPGPLRRVLDAVIGYQHGDLPDDDVLPPALMVEAYLQALTWTTKTSAAAAN